MEFGVQTVPGIKVLGLYRKEKDFVSDFYWTNGEAEFVVPINQEQTPKSLSLSLEVSNPKGSNLSILINKSEVFNHKIPQGAWTQSISLANIIFKKPQIKIELISDTFVPQKNLANSEDSRQLGAIIQRMKLQ